VAKEELIEFAKQYYEDISHPLAVANQFPEMTDEWIVGLFHDILEENRTWEIQYKLIKLLNNNWDIFRAIQYISRDEDIPYFDYIWFIKHMKENNEQGGELAWKVKIADLKHNLSRIETLKPSLKERYEKALEILEG
jgi:hypothetical protein